jgi:hypothetical protein
MSKKENPYKFEKFWFSKSFESFQENQTIEIVSVTTILTAPHDRVINSKVVESSNICFCIVYKEINNENRD